MKSNQNDGPLKNEQRAYQYSAMEEGNPPKPSLQRAKSSRHEKPKGRIMPVTSHVHLKPEHYYQGDHTHELRAGFIRKVYGLLAFQMLLTIGICAMCMYVDGLREFMIDHFKLCYYGSLVGLIVTLVGVLCNKDKVPTNYVWFLAFTCCMSVMLGVICAIYKETGGAIFVLEALILTTGLFVGLTLFTCFSGLDFSGMGVYLFAGSLIFIMWGCLLMFFGWASYFLYLLFGMLLFSGYVIYDTNQIMRKLGYDDYLIAAIELYLDFVNLFLIILGGRK